MAASHMNPLKRQRKGRVPRSDLASSVSLAQGIYYLITGVWPVISIRTFQMVTGPKVDLWLVKATGLLIAVIGAVLTLAGIRKHVEPEIQTLGVGSAAALGSIDTVYALRGRISRIYLMDALGEAVLAAGWLLARQRSARD